MQQIYHRKKYSYEALYGKNITLVQRVEYIEYPKTNLTLETYQNSLTKVTRSVKIFEQSSYPQQKLGCFFTQGKIPESK